MVTYTLIEKLNPECFLRNKLSKSGCLKYHETQLRRHSFYSHSMFYEYSEDADPMDNWISVLPG